MSSYHLSYSKVPEDERGGVSQPPSPGTHQLPNKIKNRPDLYQQPFQTDEREHKISSGAFNLTCYSVQGSILITPFIFARCGLILTPFLMLFFALYMIFSLDALCVNAAKTGAVSYPSIVSRYSGLTSSFIFTLSLVLAKLAVLIGVLILLRQVAQDIVIFFSGYHILEAYILLPALALGFPLMLCRNYRELEWSSYLAYFLVLVFLANMLAVVIMYMIARPYGVGPALRLFPVNAFAFFECVPLVALLYFPQFGVTDIMEQVNQPTKKRVFHLIVSTVSLLTLMYLVFGVVGYLALITVYNNLVTVDIVNAFPVSGMMMAGRFAIFLAIVANLPILIVPLRALMVTLYQHTRAWIRRLQGHETAEERQAREEGSGPTEASPLREWQQNQQRAMGGGRGGGAAGAPAPLAQQIHIQQVSHQNRAVANPQNQQQQPAAAAKRDVEAGGTGGTGRPATGATQPSPSAAAQAQQQVSRPEAHHSFPMNFMLTLLILIIAYVVALFIPDNVAVLWTMAGTFLILPLVLMVPSLCYIALGKRLGTEADAYTGISYFLAILTVPLMIVCAIYNIAWLA